MSKMELYDLTADVILATQTQDPFCDYLTAEIISLSAKLPHASKILDLGSGIGRTAVAFAKRGFEVTAIDREKKIIEIGKKYAQSHGLADKITYIVDDITKMKPGKGLYDAVVMQEVIEHVQDYESLLRLSYSHLRKGGYLFITTPHDPKQWNMFDEYSGHVKRFSLSELKASLVASKFKIEKLYTIGFPLHRTVLTACSFIFSRRHKKYSATLVRKNSLVKTMYTVFLWTILHIDRLFQRCDRGTTVMAVALK